ncbi:MAG: carbon-nitrogen family hydrolase, partial [Myxococcales bacterium]|nr:carbon-nitrogen family hydrolase [Myxococcales bacterium]
MKIAALQTTIAWEDPRANFDHLRPLLQAAAAAGAALVVLPEMYACGFSMNTAAIAEDIDGPSVSFLREQAAALKLWLCASVPVRVPLEDGGADRPSNLFLLAGPGGELHRYAKRHPFTFADEHLHYRAGDATTTVALGGLRISPFVCYDLRFADDFWRLAHDTDLYIVVANWPERRREHWKTLLRARAIENQAYVLGVNRVGTDGNGLDYAGDSALIDPLGEMLTVASGDP